MVHTYSIPNGQYPPIYPPTDLSPGTQKSAVTPPLNPDDVISIKETQKILYDPLLEINLVSFTQIMDIYLTP
jgi:hypothetical protein